MTNDFTIAVTSYSKQLLPVALSICINIFSLKVMVDLHIYINN